jgi:hypothetical protein
MVCSSMGLTSLWGGGGGGGGVGEALLIVRSHQSSTLEVGCMFYLGIIG